MAAKSYVLGAVLRPFTVYDANWKLVCLLCVNLPSIENGGAVPVDLPDGKKGIDITFTIRPDATWGDGVPVTTKDVLFTYDVGRDPSSAVSNAELYRRITGITVKDDKTFTLHLDKLTFDYCGDQRFRPAAGASREGARSATRRNTGCVPAMTPSRPTPASTTDPTGSARLSPGRTSCSNPTRIGPARNRHLRRVTVRAIENTAALEANLLSGTIDMVAGELGFPLEEAIAFEKRHPDAIESSISRASSSSTSIAT